MECDKASNNSRDSSNEIPIKKRIRLQSEGSSQEEEVGNGDDILETGNNQVTVDINAPRDAHHYANNLGTSKSNPSPIGSTRGTLLIRDNTPPPSETQRHPAQAPPILRCVRHRRRIEDSQRARFSGIRRNLTAEFDNIDDFGGNTFTNTRNRVPRYRWTEYVNGSNVNPQTTFSRTSAIASSSLSRSSSDSSSDSNDDNNNDEMELDLESK